MAGLGNGLPDFGDVYNNTAHAVSGRKRRLVDDSGRTRDVLKMTEQGVVVANMFPNRHAFEQRIALTAPGQSHQKKHGTLKDKREVQIEEGELAIIPARRRNNLGVDQGIVQRPLVTTSTSGMLIPPSITTQSAFENQFRVIGVSVTSFDMDPNNKQNVAIQVSGSKTIETILSDNIAPGDKLTWSFFSIDDSEQLQQLNNTRRSSGPMTKYNPIISPVTFDLIFRLPNDAVEEYMRRDLDSRKAFLERTRNLRATGELSPEEHFIAALANKEMNTLFQGIKVLAQAGLISLNLPAFGQFNAHELNTFRDLDISNLSDKGHAAAGVNNFQKGAVLPTDQKQILDERLFVLGELLGITSTPTYTARPIPHLTGLKDFILASALSGIMDTPHSKGPRDKTLFGSNATRAAFTNFTANAEAVINSHNLAQKNSIRNLIHAFNAMKEASTSNTFATALTSAAPGERVTVLL